MESEGEKMKEIRKLTKRRTNGDYLSEEWYDDEDVADKVNELVDAVNELQNPPELYADLGGDLGVVPVRGIRDIKEARDEGMYRITNQSGELVGEISQDAVKSLFDEPVERVSDQTRPTEECVCYVIGRKTCRDECHPECYVCTKPSRQERVEELIEKYANDIWDKQLRSEGRRAILHDFAKELGEL
jgi:hypothetical protein